MLKSRFAPGASELYLMNARFYPSTAPDAANPQPLNRYSYVLNNPLRYTDPTGYCAFGAPCPGFVDDAIECVGNGPDCVRDPIARAFPSSLDLMATVFRQTRDGAYAAAMWSMGTMSATSGAVAAAAEATWTAGPVEAVREYVADKGQDAANIGSRWAAVTVLTGNPLSGSLPAGLSGLRDISGLGGGQKIGKLRVCLVREL